MKVLLIEDVDYDRLNLERLIKRIPVYEVDYATNIEDAKLKIADNELVILDLKLPDKIGSTLDSSGGHKLLEYIKKNISRDKWPTVIIVSQFKKNSLAAQQIQKDHLFDFISEWFNKLEDRQRLSEYLAQYAFQKQLQKDRI